MSRIVYVECKDGQPLYEYGLGICCESPDENEKADWKAYVPAGEDGGEVSDAVQYPSLEVEKAERLEAEVADLRRKLVQLGDLVASARGDSKVLLPNSALAEVVLKLVEKLLEQESWSCKLQSDLNAALASSLEAGKGDDDAKFRVRVGNPPHASYQLEHWDSEPVYVSRSGHPTRDESEKALFISEEQAEEFARTHGWEVVKWPE